MVPRVTYPAPLWLTWAPMLSLRKKKKKNGQSLVSKKICMTCKAFLRFHTHCKLDSRWTDTLYTIVTSLPRLQNVSYNVPLVLFLHRHLVPLCFHVVVVYVLNLCCPYQTSRGQQCNLLINPAFDSIHCHCPLVVSFSLMCRLHSTAILHGFIGTGVGKGSFIDLQSDQSVMSPFYH